MGLLGSSRGLSSLARDARITPFLGSPYAVLLSGTVSKWWARARGERCCLSSSTVEADLPRCRTRNGDYLRHSRFSPARGTASHHRTPFWSRCEFLLPFYTRPERQVAHVTARRDAYQGYFSQPVEPHAPCRCA